MNILSQKFPVLAGGLWCLAFLASFHVSDTISLTLFTTCVLLTFLWSFLVLSKDIETGWAVPQAPVLGLCGVFFLLVICSLFWSEVKPVTLLTICQFSVFPLTFLTMAVRPDEKMFRTIACVFVPLFVGLGLWAVTQYYFLYEYFYGQAQHPLQDPSSLGALFSMILFCAIGWMLTNGPKWHKGIAFILACILIAGIYATAARGPVFPFFPAFAVMLILLWPRVKAAKGAMLSLLVAFIAIPAFMNVTGSDQGSLEMSRRIWQTLTLELRGGDISNMRTFLWSSAWEMIKDQPWLGRGYGTFYLYLPEYMDSRYPSIAFHAHSDQLQMWAELGIAGIALFYAFLLAAGIRTVRALKHTGKETEYVATRIVIVTTFCALLAMIGHSHVTFNLYNPAIIMPAAFLLAVWFYATRRVLQDKTVLLTMQDNLSPAVNKAVLSLPYLMLGAVFFMNVAGEYYAGKARDNLFAHQMMDFADNINKAKDVSQDMNYRVYLLAVNVPLTLFDVDKASKTAEERRALYDQGMGYMQRVLALNPRSDAAYYYMAKLQELAGPDALPDDVEGINYLYEEALRLNPMHLGARIALMKRYKAEGRPKEEIYAVMEAVAHKDHINPVAAEYYKELATLYVEHGDYIKSNEAMAKMKTYFDRLSYFERARSKGVMENLLRFDPAEAPTQPAFPQMTIPVPETSGKTGEGL